MLPRRRTGCPCWEDAVNVKLLHDAEHAQHGEHARGAAPTTRDRHFTLQLSRSFASCPPTAMEPPSSHTNGHITNGDAHSGKAQVAAMTDRHQIIDDQKNFTLVASSRTATTSDLISTGKI